MTQLAQQDQPTRREKTFLPRFDIVETENELTLLGDLPGVEPQDLELRFENSELTVLGRVRPRQEQVTFLAQEYALGDFRRVFRVGEAIDAANIAAELKHGVLTIHLPKSETVKPRRIDVKVSE